MSNINSSLHSSLQKIIDLIIASQSQYSDAGNIVNEKRNFILSITSSIEHVIIRNIKELEEFTKQLIIIHNTAKEAWDLAVNAPNTIQPPLDEIMKITSNIYNAIIPAIERNLEKSPTLSVYSPAVSVPIQVTANTSAPEPELVEIKDGKYDDILNTIDYNTLLRIEQKTGEEPVSWKNLQFIAGFDIPLTDNDNPLTDNINFLNFLTTDSVYERLEILAENNIIAVSELAKGVGDETKVEEIYFKKYKPKFHGCNLDTGFITSKAVLDAIPIQIPDPLSVKDETRENLVILSVGNLKIVSIHFDSAGPKSIVIEEFIDKQFKRFVPTDKLGTIKEVNVICGDTNITVEKSKVKDRDTIGMQIAKGLNNYFGTSNSKQEWLVLMSSHKIIKNRRGFLLRNQQIAKTVGNSVSELDADGTILAVKVYTDKKEPIIKEWISELATNSNVTNEYVIYSHEGSKKIIETEEGKIPGKALNFVKEPINAVNEYGEPTEKIFIDHSVLYTRISSLDRYVTNDLGNIGIYKGCGNLIVLNLNSMINSGKKNWNLQHRGIQKNIKQLDEKIFNIFKDADAFYDKDGKTLYKPDYKDFSGKDKFYDANKTKSIIKLLTKLTPLTPLSGGRKSRKPRKSRKSRKSRKLRKSRKPRKPRKLRKSRKLRRR